VPKERFEHKRLRAQAVVDRLDQAMPEAKIELDYRTPLELLVAVILSAQCTDQRVNLVTPALFRRYRSAAAYATAELAELESLIRTCGLYRSKAKNLIAAARALVAERRGEVPTSREALARLPGVGAKTAGVVAVHLGGDLAFPVDTHIFRLAHRLDFSRGKTPDQVEADLQVLLPPPRWAKGHQLLIWHGRRTCGARAPACARCAVEEMCPKRGVLAVPPRAPGAAPARRRPRR
jgi:endonuclease III